MIALYLSTEGWDPVSMAIRVVTHSKWSHVGFVDMGEDGSQRTVSAMLNGGVKVRSLPREYLLLTAPAVELAYKYAEGQLGKPYDWFMITGMIFNRDWHRADRWYCSELVAASFAAVGSPLFNSEFSANWITPRDILLSPCISKV